MAYSIDGNPVSREWYIVLSACRNDGIRFHLNEGRRAIKQQWKFWRLYRSGGNLAAYPSPTAPHIRVGRIDHALDVESTGRKSDGVDAVISWAARRGVRLVKTVQGEAWHIEIAGGGKALRRFSRRITPAKIAFSRPERRTINLIRGLRSKKSTVARRAAIRAAKGTIQGYRAGIRSTAKRGGWNKNDRKRRYKALGEIYNG
ncbi:MAG: hypothetical protein H0T60_02535 [Acidobacteria bacterium]|nr:hypothetical protein [Acidobacteriota bacterium]